MKILGIILAFAMLLSTPLSAGSLVFNEEMQDEIVMVEDEPMGSSGAWIIPLIAIGLIGLVLANPREGRGRPTFSELAIRSE